MGVRFIFDLIDRVSGPSAKINKQLGSVSKALDDAEKRLSAVSKSGDKGSKVIAKGLEKEIGQLYKRKAALIGGQVLQDKQLATADKVAVGREVTLVGYASKEKADELRAERITMDGKTVELR